MGLARTASSYSGQSVGVTLNLLFLSPVHQDILFILPSEYTSARLMEIINSPHTGTSNPLYATLFSAQYSQNSITAFYCCVFIMFAEYCLSSLIHTNCVVRISAVRGITDQQSQLAFGIHLHANVEAALARGAASSAYGRPTVQTLPTSWAKPCLELRSSPKLFLPQASSLPLFLLLVSVIGSLLLPLLLPQQT